MRIKEQEIRDRIIRDKLDLGIRVICDNYTCLNRGDRHLCYLEQYEECLKYEK
ncbi:MAG: hypothetical protein ACP5D2_02490 [Candidatus Nanoarchaeia archaeon]